MAKLCLSAVLTAIFAINVAIGDKTHVFYVTKHLENGDELPVEKWSKFTIVCPDHGHLHLVAFIPFENPSTTVYFANDDKNVLKVCLDGRSLVGYKYETPYGKNQTLTGAFLTREDGGVIKTNIPRIWVPHNTTRISASVKVSENMYNYYGIFNRPISIEDTMVVEEFKKVKLC